MGNKGIRVNSTGTKVDWMAPRDNWQDVARGYINRYRGGESEESPPVVVPTTPEPAGPTLAKIREALAAKAREKAQVAMGTPVTCRPLANIECGTVAQYLAMQIGWPLCDANGNERRDLNNISPGFGRFPSGNLHLGFDIRDPVPGAIVGTPVLAVVDGRVVSTTTVLRRPDGSIAGQGFHISIQATSEDLRDPVTRQLLIFSYQHLLSAPTITSGSVSKGQINWLCWKLRQHSKQRRASTF